MNTLPYGVITLFVKVTGAYPGVSDLVVRLARARPSGLCAALKRIGRLVAPAGLSFERSHY
jgi:hypothetical protein